MSPRAMAGCADWLRNRASLATRVHPGKLRQLPPAMLVGGGILLMFLVPAAFGPWLVPYGPSELGTGPPFGNASWQHLFGTDALGRDVFSRVVSGTRIELGLALAGTLLGAGVGAVIGLMSAYFGGWIDEGVMRI